MSDQTQIVMDRVRRALGRTGPLKEAPIPPSIDESITRLTSPTADLQSLFIKQCEENKMHVQVVSPETLTAALTDYLRSENVRRVALSAGGVLDRLSLCTFLRTAGLDAKTWPEITLDDLYDFDCGITSVDYAIAETGSLAVRASIPHGRGLSLVPPIHVAIVEKSNLLPDLLDLFATLTRTGTGSALSLITGPSKTSDIEMNLVIGVHGPLKVQVFFLK